jgi:hypothetical protein
MLYFIMTNTKGDNMDWVEKARRDMTYIWRDSDWIQEQAENPKWDKRERIHDWRNHVPVDKATWDILPMDAKIICVMIAERDAQREDWD